jgi:hypothetical protein
MPSHTKKKKHSRVFDGFQIILASSDDMNFFKTKFIVKHWWLENRLYSFTSLFQVHA